MLNIALCRVTRDINQTQESWKCWGRCCNSYRKGTKKKGTKKNPTKNCVIFGLKLQI